MPLWRNGISIGRWRYQERNAIKANRFNGEMAKWQIDINAIFGEAMRAGRSSESESRSIMLQVFKAIIHGAHVIAITSL